MMADGKRTFTNLGCLRTFKIQNSFEKSNQNELKEGIKIEAEHKDLYDEIKKRLTKENVKMPMKELDFYKWIAKQHIHENKDYYKLLKKYIEDEN